MQKKTIAALVLVADFAICLVAFTNCGGGFGVLSSDMKSVSGGLGASGGSSGSGAPAVPALPSLSNQASPATSGTPLIHQIRGGVEVATYKTLGEAFARTHAFRTYETGDTYELDPAVYSGTEQQAWIGPLPKDDAEFNRGPSNFLIPTNLTLRGRTINGFRPVVKVDSNGVGYNNLGQGALYVDQSENIVVENIDFDGGGPSVPSSGKAGLYLNGAKNFTLRDSRVLHFNQSNGIFSTGSNSGKFLFENVETGFNGGDSGPEHNYYLGTSTVDSNHSAVWRGCYSHDVYYGHTLKSRVQNNLVEGCYLKGKRAAAGDQGEAYLADFPNGGNVVVRDTILEKDYSGDNSNGIFITYAMEGQKFASSSSISITHNTFVARVKTFDTAGHFLWPMNFFYPGSLPSDAGFPVSPVTVQGNLFVGFANAPDLMSPSQLYRGTDDLDLPDLSQINANIELLSRQSSKLNAVGELMPMLSTGTALRSRSTFGARD